MKCQVRYTFRRLHTFSTLESRLFFEGVEQLRAYKRRMLAKKTDFSTYPNGYRLSTASYYLLASRHKNVNYRVKILEKNKYELKTLTKHKVTYFEQKTLEVRRSLNDYVN